MNRIDFKPPSGLQMPEGTKPGDKVEFIAEFEVKPNGELCIVGIEGNSMPGYDEKKEAEPPRESGKFMEAYNGAMGGQ